MRKSSLGSGANERARASFMGPRHVDLGALHVALGPFSDNAAWLAVLKVVIDPPLVAATLYVLAWRIEGQIHGLVFLLGVLAALLAGNLLDTSALFVPGTKHLRHVLRLLGNWIMVAGFTILLGVASGVLEHVSFSLIECWLLLTPLLLILTHSLVRLGIRRKDKTEVANRQAIIVGATSMGSLLAEEIRRHPLLHIALKGYFDDRESGRVDVAESEIIGCLVDIPAYVHEHNIQCIYITLPMSSQPRILSLLDSLKDTTVSIYFVPDLFVFDLIQARFDHMASIPLVSICETPFIGVQGVVKRVEDLVLASIILVLLAIPMLLMAVLVKMTSDGPVLFKQRRYGLDGQEIVVYKFRSMTVMEDGEQVVQATQNDARVTPIGSFMRRTSFDELPQFINVLQGRMSIVGPRPHANAHNEQYRKLIKGYMVRHKVKPGITGWAQVNGFRGETDTLDKMEMRIAYDLDYLRHWSLDLDLKIIARTALMAFSGKNAY